jgi:hypothetical protein
LSPAQRGARLELARLLRELVLRALDRGEPRADLVFGRICRFRDRGTEYVRESGMKWMSGGARRQCEASPRADPGQRRVQPLRGRRLPYDTSGCISCYQCATSRSNPTFCAVTAGRRLASQSILRGEGR